MERIPGAYVRHLKCDMTEDLYSTQDLHLLQLVAISVRIVHTSMDPANLRIHVLQSVNLYSTYIAQDYYNESGT